MLEITVGYKVFRTDKVGSKYSASVYIGPTGFASPKLYDTEAEADEMTKKCAEYEQKRLDKEG